MLNAKSESLFLQRKNPRKIHWTVVFRKMHKKGITEEVAKKRSRRTVKHQRAVVGATWELINQKKTQNNSEREKLRQEAIQKAKTAKKTEEAKKKAERAKVQSFQAGKQGKLGKSAAQKRAPAKNTASSKR